MKTTQPSTTAIASKGETPQKIDPAEIVSAALKLAKKTGEPVNFCHANLEEANLRGADLRGANLSGAFMAAANLRGAFMAAANLRGADLRKANLRGADLMGANLLRADLLRADLRGADLRKAGLRGAFMAEADLGRADLRGAFMAGANLGCADLRGANLGCANLLGACLSETNLTQLKWCDFECELIGFSQYPLFAVRQKEGLRFYAGCKTDLTETKALEHWGERLNSSYVDVQIRAQAFIWAIKHFVQKTKEKA